MADAAYVPPKRSLPETSIGRLTGERVSVVGRSRTVFCGAVSGMSTSAAVVVVWLVALAGACGGGLVVVLSCADADVAPARAAIAIIQPRPLMATSVGARFAIF